MMMPTLIMAVMAAVAAVSAAFGVEGSAHPYKIRFEALQHILDHMVRPNTNNPVSDFGGQMPISQMPSKAHQLIGIFMPDFDNELRSGLDLQQPAIIKLQAISIRHRNRIRKIEKDVFALIRRQANAAAMARVEIESESACRPFLRPMPGGAMN
jgi:hypothetical protein